MNFKMIPAENKHLPAMAALLSPTGYWRAGIEKNTLGLDYETFATRYVLEPLLPHTVVAVQEDNTDNVLGFMSGAKTDVLDAIPSHHQYYHPKIIELFSQIAQLEFSPGYAISLLSVDPRFRGRHIGKALFEYAEKQATQAQCDTISLIVWTFNRDAIQFYLNQNMLVTGSIYLDAPVSNTLLRMEKNPTLTRHIHFFETQAYQTFHLV